MVFIIDQNGTKTNAFGAAWDTAYAKISEWKGRSVAAFKSGTETALPYLQDQRIAVASLVGITVILNEIANLFIKFGNRSVVPTMIRTPFELTAAVGIIGGGAFAFANFAQLPLTAPVIGGVALITSLIWSYTRQSLE